MLAYACQLGEKALKVGNYIIYFPVYLDTIYTLSLFLIPMQCSVFTSQKHPKHHFERHKLHHGLSMSTAQLLQPTSTARRRLPKSPLDIWMLDRMQWSCVSWWVTGRSLVTGETEKKTRIKINVQVSQVLQMSCALLGALARDFLSHKILTMIEISSL